MNNVAGTTQVALTLFGGIDQSLAPSDLPQGLSSDNLNCAFQPGSVFTRPPLKRSAVLPGSGQVIYATSFTKPTGQSVTLEFTSDGKIYADGTQIGQTQAGNRAKVISMFDRAFIALSDGDHGADVPLQFDGTNLDRVSQDGPGAAPTFAATAIASDQYPISTITQPAAQSRGYSYFLQSSGVGSTTAGNNVTIYYSDSTGAGPDTDLVNAFNSGFPVYAYVEFVAGASHGATFGPQVVLITGVGEAPPPGQPRSFYYFTFTATSSAYTYYRGSDGAGNVANYQRTLATITTSTAVPELEVNDNISISGTSASPYNSAWTVTQTPNSGTVAITETQLTGGTATYNYSVSTGVAPTAGQPITITGTLNAGGILNVTNATIATCTGGNSGSFTITGFSGPDFPSAVESGAGVTAGTVFTIEPGAKLLGSPTSPIYGNSTGGYLVFAGSQATVAPGTRQGVVFFITRSGYTTAPSPKATFTVPSNTNAISVTNLPIGPSNVIARAVAFTGANGGRFFYLPVAPQLNGVVSGTSTVVNDNVSTSATFYFADESLLAATAIDIPGNNLFRQVVLGPSLAMFPYAGRLFAWGERNKVQGFLNMGFEGGILSGSPNKPLGWTVTGTSTLTAGDYGLAWQSDGTGSLSQSAYQRQSGALILDGGTQYTFRCWVNGSATATLSSASKGFSATASVSGSAVFAQANFSALTPAIIPSDLTLTIHATGTVDELELVYTNNPYLQTARASYIDNPEAFDSVSGIIGPANDPHAVRTLFLRRNVLHMLTDGPDGSLYETQDTASGEPNTWDVGQVAAKCGAISVWGDATFEDWQVWASDTGLRIYDGGSVEKMSGEVQDWWDSFNAHQNLTVVANDPDIRRTYIGGVTGNATQPNSWYVMDYRELNTAGAMSNSTPLKIGFSGKMLTTDLTRKWSPWNLSVVFAGLVNGRMTFCGGTTAPTTYTLLEGNLTGVDDDYGAFQSFYAPYYMLTAEEAEALKLQANRKLFTYLTLNVNGIGKVQVTPLLNAGSHPGTSTRAVNLPSVSTFDLQFPINIAADRVSFKVSSVQVNGQGGFWLSGVTVALADHPYSIVRGWNG